ncbi:MAG: ABC transporter permease [Treponema sp.]|nr:ABC transporter permease [Treponema sp.]
MFSIRLSKKDNPPLWQTLLIKLAAIFLALLVCALVIISVTDLNPFEVYGGIFNGALGTKRRVWVTIRDTLVLLLVAVGLVPAFKMRFWNIGAEGQMLMGGLASAALMIYGSNIPNWLLLPMIMVCSCLAGVLWGIIPAFFKSKFNTNETLFTLMMNYIAIQMISFSVVFWENPKGSNSVGIINPMTNAGWFPNLFGQRYGLNLLIVILVTVFIAFYLRYTKHGYELSVVGESWDTARYAGINVQKVIIRTMALSGAICGLAGCLVVSGASHTVSTSLAGGRGFTAIIVAWMSNFNSGAMVLISFFLCFMENGAIQIASQFGLNENVSDIIIGIIIFFLIGSSFFSRYKVSIEKTKGAEKSIEK